MSAQAGFALRGRNPDVLTCIANLSNDEVFTPPELVEERTYLVLPAVHPASVSHVVVLLDTRADLTNVFTTPGP